MNTISDKVLLTILTEHKKYFNLGETKSIDFRLKQLEKLKLSIKKNEDLILSALKEDLNKSEFEAYASEIGYLYDSINYFKKNLKKWTKPKRVRTPLTHFPATSYLYKEPYGTALIIGPFNYPFQLVMEPLLGAIISGNCAVVKPSEFTPNTSNIIKKVLKETFDEQYIRVIEGGSQVTSSLINSSFDYIFFTGSVGVGKIVMEAAGKNLTPVTLELGGKSPCIVHEDANISSAAERITWGKFLNVGQTCVAPDYILVHRSIKEAFIEELKNNIVRFYGENPRNSTDYGRIVNTKHTERLINLIDNDKVIFGGQYNINDRYISPTLLDPVDWKDKIMDDEIFGPLLPIIEYENLSDVISKINSKSKPLALYLFTESSKVKNLVLDNVSYGGGCVNDTMLHVASHFLPFGGVGHSGIGAYHGKSSFDTFSHTKSVIKKSSRFGISLIFPPYNKKKTDLIKKIMK